jgi:hypothetical protein
MSDVCHPADPVPLMREFMEDSVSGVSISGTGDIGSSPGAASNLLRKSVDLLLRAHQENTPAIITHNNEDLCIITGFMEPCIKYTGPHNCLQ